MARVRVQVPMDESEDQTPVETIDGNTPDQAQEQVSNERVNRRNFLPRKLRSPLAIGSLLLAVILIVLVAMLVNDRRNLKQQVERLSTPQAQTNEEVESLKQEVGQLIELPGDEAPTVATVVDASKVKGQAFFKNAQNGDKVLLFAKAGKAILYRPDTKKIIEVAPINLGNSESGNGQSGSGTAD